MNIFFSASIHGKLKFQAQYAAIIKATQTLGHTIQADHIMNTTAEQMAKWSDDEDTKYHLRVLEGIRTCDILFAEVSSSSTSVGYLIAQAVTMGKPVVIFYTGHEEPHIFKTLEEQNEKIVVVRYHGLDLLSREIESALDFVSSAQDIRFNFFISPRQSNYLDWIAKNKKISRSVYLRGLIDVGMQRDILNKDDSQ